MPKKGGLGLFTDLRGGLGKKEEGGVFEGRSGLIPRCTYVLSKITKLQVLAGCIVHLWAVSSKVSIQITVKMVCYSTDRLCCNI